MSQAMQLATAQAAVLLKQTVAPVASIFGLSDVRAMDDTPEPPGWPACSTTSTGARASNCSGTGYSGYPALTRSNART
jgi:hypothetical protein